MEDKEEFVRIMVQMHAQTEVSAAAAAGCTIKTKAAAAAAAIPVVVPDTTILIKRVGAVAVDPTIQEPTMTTQSVRTKVRAKLLLLGWGTDSHRLPGGDYGNK
jgi:hypothetical protein